MLPTYFDFAAKVRRFWIVALCSFCVLTQNAAAVDEIIVDDLAATFSGSWSVSTNSPGKYETTYRLATTVTNTATATATFTPEISTPGRYDIYIWYPQVGVTDLAWQKTAKDEIYIWHPQGGDRITDAAHFISFNGGTQTASVNQTSNDGAWQLIASGKEFEAGTSGFVQISNSSSVAGKVVMVDAVRLVYSVDQGQPIITTQPVSRTNNSGTVATFSITLTGTAPLGYQWKKGGVDLVNGGNISGATSATLTLANVSQGDAANYIVVLTNSIGSVTSSVATLTVIVPPTIIAQPTSRTNNSGTTATFSVAATGTAPLYYQWRKSGLDLSDGGNISGANAATLALSAVTLSDGANYSVVVSNVAGFILSSNAVLVVGSSDTNRPTVAVGRPANNSKTNVAEVVMTGTAKDTPPGVIVDVKYRLLPEAEFASAALWVTNGQTNWVTPSLTLRPGTNVAHVYSVDAGGNTSLLKTNIFYYDSTTNLTVKIQGVGQVKTNSLTLVTNEQRIPLLVGRPFALTAFVGAGTNHVFTNWTGGTNVGSLAEMTTNLINKFIMQSNLIVQANFIPNPFTPVAGIYSGLFSESQEDGGVRHQSAGFFTVTLSAKASYSGSLIFDGDKISISGKFDLSGRTIRSVSRATKGKGNVNLFLELDWSTGSEQIRGTLSDGNWTSILLGDKATFNLATNPATEFMGTYTYLVPRNLSGQAPAGFGYGLVTNSAAGMVSLSGALGDGAATVQKVSVSKDGLWPLYVQLYKTTNVITNLTTQLPLTNKANYRGSLLGWVTFTNQTPVGTVNWIKTAEAATNYFYPNGYTNSVDLIGSPYQAPVPGVRALNLINGMITFSGGNLSGPIAWGLTWASNNTIVSAGGADKPTFTLTPKTGLLKGYFWNPQLGNIKTNFTGALLQNQNYSGGFFQGTNQSGSFLLQGD